VAEVEEVAPDHARPAGHPRVHVGAHDRLAEGCPSVHRPEGGPVSDEHFRNRVWYPAIAAVRHPQVPAPDMRHTAASWLVQDGVPLYDVQAPLGHEDYATTQRYAHLAPDAHGRIIDSWKHVLAHVWRTSKRRPVPHDEKRAPDLGRGGRI
jgi:integrase